MENDNKDKMENVEVTSAFVGFVGVVGTIVSLIYFVLASRSEKFTTIQLIIILLMLFTNAGVMLIGFITNNTKATWFIPYAMGILSNGINGATYLYDYMENAQNYYSKFNSSGKLGTAIFYFLIVISLLVAYLGIIGRIKKNAVGIICMGFCFGSYVYSFVLNFPQLFYGYFRSEQLTVFGITAEVFLLSSLRYLIYIIPFFGMIVLGLSAFRKEVLDK